jgi:hypothetical protein
MPIQRFPGRAFVENSLPATVFSTDVAGPRIANIQVTDSNYSVTGAANVSTAGGYIRINGTGFVSGCTVIIGSLAAGAVPNVAPSVSFINSTRVNAQVPANSAGSRTVFLVNPDGSTALKFDGVSYS